jgi:nitroreductase
MTTARTPLTVPEAIEARHAIRSYTADPVPASDLDEILRLTQLAPSANNAQPWRWIVVRDPQVKAQVHAAAFHQKQVASAPVVLVLWSDMPTTLAQMEVLMHPGVQGEKRAKDIASFRARFSSTLTPEQRDSWGQGQSFIALGFLLLAAQSFGYSTSPMAGFDPEAIKSLFALPSTARVSALVAMGIADEPGFSRHRLPLESVVRTV